MEKSTESHKKKGEENNADEDSDKDEVQEEREILEQIYKNCSNMNDAISFNSADDVRQAQKHSNGGMGLRICDEEEANVPSRNDGDHYTRSKAKAVPKNKKKEEENTDSRHQKSRPKRPERSNSRSKVKKVPKKRPGRPPKAGPSRKVKKSTVKRTLVSIYSSSSSLLSTLSSGY